MTEINLSDKFHGIISHTGKVHEKQSGYNPGCHDALARQHGYKDSKDLLRQGGVRFAQYEGGANYSPGNRIEYDYQNPSAHKHIIKHIKNNPTSGGYSILRRNENRDNDNFTEHRTASGAIRHLKDSQ